MVFLWNLLYTFRIPFPKNTSAGLLPDFLQKFTNNWQKYWSHPGRSIDIVRAEGYSEPCQTSKNERFMKTDFFAKSSLLDIWLSSEYNSLGCVRKLYPEIFVILGAGTGQWRTERWINLDKNLRAFQTSKSIAYYVISSKCKLHCCLWSVVFLKKYSMQIWFENYLKKKLGYCFSLILSRVKNHTLNSMFDTTLY